VRIESIDHELVVLDSRSGVVHRLDASAASVVNRVLSGDLDEAALTAHQRDAVAALESIGVLVTHDTPGGLSRRSALVGAAAVVGVTTIMLPFAAAASSLTVQSGTGGTDAVVYPGELVLRAANFDGGSFSIGFYWKSGLLPTPLTEISGQEPNHYSWTAELFFGDSPSETLSGFGQFADNTDPVFTSLNRGDGERVVLTVTYFDGIQNATFTGVLELPGNLFDGTVVSTTSFDLTEDV
jgi:hypothetical protein